MHTLIKKDPIHIAACRVVSRQQLGKHVRAATDTHAAIATDAHVAIEVR
jgi:hypothetical protein